MSTHSFDLRVASLNLFVHTPFPTCSLTPLPTPAHCLCPSPRSLSLLWARSLVLPVAQRDHSPLPHPLSMPVTTLVVPARGFARYLCSSLISLSRTVVPLAMTAGGHTRFLCLSPISLLSLPVAPLPVSTRHPTRYLRPSAYSLSFPSVSVSLLAIIDQFAVCARSHNRCPLPIVQILADSAQCLIAFSACCPTHYTHPILSVWFSRPSTCPLTLYSISCWFAITAMRAFNLHCRSWPSELL